MDEEETAAAAAVYMKQQSIWYEYMDTTILAALLFIAFLMHQFGDSKREKVVVVSNATEEETTTVRKTALVSLNKTECEFVWRAASVYNSDATITPSAPPADDDGTSYSVTDAAPVEDVEVAPVSTESTSDDVADVTGAAEADTDATYRMSAAADDGEIKRRYRTELQLEIKREKEITIKLLK